MERSILHVDMVDFPVAAERIADPTLKGRPVLISPPGARSRVFWASEEARKWGAARGMFLGDALKLCRGAQVVPPNERLYLKVRENVFQIIGNYSPLAEPSEIGRAFVDLSGTGRLFGPARDTARRISREIQNGTGMASRLGLSTNKSTSEVASDVSRDALVDVTPGGEETFLAPQPAQYLPGTEEVEPGLLSELNITHISQFARMSPAQLALVFGRIGPVLHMRARGFDSRPVRPPEKKPAIVEEIDLARDTNNPDELLDTVYTLLEKGAFRLRAAKKAAGTIELFLAYSDNIHTEGKARLSPATNLDAELFEFARGIFKRILQRRVRVAYLRVGFTDMAAAREQLDLFPVDVRLSGREIMTPNPWPRSERELLGALDHIRTRFGVGALIRGNLECRALST